MLQQKGYRFRIYPDRKQADQISAFFGCCRYVYNHCLTYRKETYAVEGRNVSVFECMREVTSMRSDPGTPWLRDCDSMALQEAVKDLDSAYRNFFAKRAGYPKYRKKHTPIQSYRTRNQNNGIRFEGNRLYLPKLGPVRIKRSRDIRGRILNATISRTPTGRYFVALCVEEEVVPGANGGGMIGIDVGIRSFYTGSNGKSVTSPAPLHVYEKKLRREQRKLSRRIEANIAGYDAKRRPIWKRPLSECRNIQEQRRRVARVHERIADIRNDFLHKESTRLVSENQVIALEDLNVQGMLRNHHLSKSIADASWSGFIRMIEYKAYAHGTQVIRVPRFYASSQTCSCCGYKNPAVKDLRVREWTCPECGAFHDRDLNAAVNILNKAMSMM